MIGSKLKALRAKKGVTIAQLCNELQMNQNTYAKYERDERDVSTETLSKLADFYNVTTDYLLGREPAPDPFAEMKINPNIEKELLAKYMKLPDKMRASVLNVLYQLGDIVAAGMEITESTTAGAQHDLAEAASAITDAEAEKTAG